MGKEKMALFLLCFFILILNIRLVYAPTGALDGFVIDSVTGQGIYGAVVKVWLGGENYITTTTIQDGYFEFLYTIPEGWGYSCIITKANYNPKTSICPDIVAGSRKHLGITPPPVPNPNPNAANVLIGKPATGTIHACATDCCSGENLSNNTRLTINYAQLRSDSFGCGDIRLNPGTYSVDARTDGYYNFLQFSVLVYADQTTNFNFCMTPVYFDCGLRIFDGTSTVIPACSNNSCSPLRIYNGSDSFSLILVDVTDSMATKVRIKTNSGIKALRKL